MATVSYPSVRRSDHVDELHGTQLADPYRWLEDPDSEETKQFVEAQNACTAAVYAAVPSRKEIRARMTELYNYEKYSCPWKHCNRYFFMKNDGLQNQSVLYIQDSLESPPKVLLDPNKLSADGTAALGATAISEGKRNPDQLYYAYGVSRGGSDWQTVRVLSIAPSGEGTVLEDTVQWMRYSGLSWAHDDSGFFYSCFPAPKGLEGTDPDAEDCKRGTETDIAEKQQLKFHRLGTSQAEDVLIFEYPEKPKYYLGGEVTLNGEYLVIYIRDGCKNATMVYIAELGDSFDAWLRSRQEGSLIPVVKLVDDMESSFDYILNKGTSFYFTTNKDAPRERIVRTDIKAAAPALWEEVIPQPPGTAKLEDAMLANHTTLVVKYLSDVKHEVILYDLTGRKTGELTLPGVGSVILRGSHDDNELFFKFTSFLYPGSSFRSDLNAPADAPKLIRGSTVAGFDASLYETKQVFFPSKDGTKVPMFIVQKKGLALDGDNPTYLYGYGGFNISLLPSFSVFPLIFLQHLKGVLVYANLRGGGEYGEEWHLSGTFDKKQNVFDDFACAAEYLISAGYTKPKRLAIHGGSNGGLLVAASLNQRPDLFRCGVAAVGVMDMLRFHKFTCGHGWCTDFGNPDEKEAFEYLRAYSPLHNIPDPESVKEFPCMLLTTGDHDDRVVPLHSFKYIAQLQHKLGSKFSPTENPFIVRIETKAGHGAGKPTSKIIEEYADVYAFMAWALKQEYSP
mmetsp:Transcript_7105/g.15314  ORF Transcript_7105/g.15314 Transcript_7105/m.15314 type:complete len:734 (+) Transcript_7105:49-2250(+)